MLVFLLIYFLLSFNFNLCTCASIPGNDLAGKDIVDGQEGQDAPAEPFNPSEFLEAKFIEFSRNPHGSRAYENEFQFQKNFLVRNGLVNENKRWPKINGYATIPYSISSAFSASERLIIVKAFDDFHENTCIRFVPRISQRDYVHIISKENICDSDAGRVGGEQTLSLGQDCVYTDIAIHELNHAIGFWHEQNRPDRDSYITIYLQNVIPGNRFNFDKMTPNQVNAYSQKYDTSSIMHYDKFAFSKDYGKLVVMEPKVPDPKMGLAVVLSKTDIAKINLMYRCANRNAAKPPKHGSPQKFFKADLALDECMDTHENCTSFVMATDNSCESNPWIRVNCRKSCSLCDFACEDNHETCPTWALNGECETHPEYMRLYCPKSCSGCS